MTMSAGHSRDILRDDHHAPIACDDSRKGFKLTDSLRENRGFTKWF